MCSLAVRLHCLFQLFVPPVLFSGSTYPALSQYKFLDFAAGQRRVKLYPLWLHIVLLHADIEESLCWYLVTGKCLFLLSQGEQQSGVLRSAPETHPVSLTWQVLTQQPNHHSNPCTDSAHPKHHTKEVQANLPHTSVLASATWQLGHYRSTSRSTGHLRRPCTTQLCYKCSDLHSYRRHLACCINNLTGLIPPVGFYWHPSSEYHIFKLSLDVLPFE